MINPKQKLEAIKPDLLEFIGYKMMNNIYKYGFIQPPNLTCSKTTICIVNKTIKRIKFKMKLLFIIF